MEGLHELFHEIIKDLASTSSAYTARYRQRGPKEVQHDDGSMDEGDEYFFTKKSHIILRNQFLYGDGS